MMPSTLFISVFSSAAASSNGTIWTIHLFYFGMVFLDLSGFDTVCVKELKGQIKCIPLLNSCPQELSDQYASSSAISRNMCQPSSE